MFRRDSFQTDPVQALDQPSVYTREDRSETSPDPKLDLLFGRSNFGSIPDRFRTVLY